MTSKEQKRLQNKISKEVEKLLNNFEDTSYYKPKCYCEDLIEKDGECLAYHFKFYIQIEDLKSHIVRTKIYQGWSYDLDKLPLTLFLRYMWDMTKSITDVNCLPYGMKCIKDYYEADKN